MIAVDTNILVYAHRSSSPEHRRAKAAIERASANRAGWGIAAPSVGEFFAVVTHPNAAGRPSTAEEAKGFLSALVETAGMQYFVPGQGFAPRLLQLASDTETTGSRVFDLQIALAASDSGATMLWTHDRNFVKIPGLRVEDPL